MNCWVILKATPSYNSNSGNYGYQRFPVLVINDSTMAEVKTFVDGLNAKVETHVKALTDHRASIHRKEELMEELSHKPPYQEIVAIVGPKPVYDHLKENDRAYNDSHVSLVAAWRHKFFLWADDHPDEWKAHREALVNHMIDSVNTETLGDDEFDIAGSVAYEPGGRYRMEFYYRPEFTAVQIPIRGLTS